MRKHLFVFLVGAPLCFGLIHCVGSDPSVGGGDDSTDGGGNDATQSGDGATNDSSPANDGGTDAAANDSCIGFTDCPNQIPSATSLQIWLRGGFGETCSGGLITSWVDQSGKAHNASPPTLFDGGAAIPAQCGVMKINGHDVVTFNPPVPADAGNETQFGDGTMNVDLAFAGGTDYTFFIVQQSASDIIEGMLSTDNSKLPGSPILSCATVDNESAFFLGYQQLVATAGFGFSYSQGCSGGVAETDNFVIHKTELDEVVFSGADGHFLYVNGTQAFEGDKQTKDLESLGSVNVGAIGRGVNLFNDQRYSGHIAEIIGFSKALPNPERVDVEGYLKRQWGLSF